MLALTRSNVRALLTMPECIAAVEEAFAAQANGQSLSPVLAHVDAEHGEFHIKAGGLRLTDWFFALKVNGGFFKNPSEHRLPAIQGIILLSDASKGTPLALLDSIEITALRTGATTAVAAKHLARPDSQVATICGCGTQGRVQLRALKEVLPLKEVFAWSRTASRAESYAKEMSEELGFKVTPVSHLENCVPKSDVVVTCTPGKVPFLQRSFVRPGTFIAAVGADSPSKQELDTKLVAEAAVVPDLVVQASVCGELHHAIAAGLMRKEDIRGELGEVITGRKPGRRDATEITIFDSTGTALQDAAAAIVVYRRALAAGKGTSLELNR